MSEIQVLVSTMENDFDLHNRMDISDAIIINQTTTDQPKVVTKNKAVYYNYNEKGLSVSRNRAISHSKSKICIISDDDVKFKNKYEKAILKAYEDYPEADVIVFQVTRIGGERNKTFCKVPKRLNRFTIMKVSSVEITFKRESIVKNKIKFNPLFGAGAKFQMGEENLFLKDCLEKGLNIYYVPVEIAKVNMNTSSWFNGYGIKYFESKGAFFKAYSPILWPILNVQFLIRKRKVIKSDSLGFFSKLLAMTRGSIKFRIR